MIKITKEPIVYATVSQYDSNPHNYRNMNKCINGIPIGVNVKVKPKKKKVVVNEEC